MRNVVLRNITNKADDLAREYNKTKDPGLREQWFKLVRSFPLDNLKLSHKETSDIILKTPQDWPKTPDHRTK